MSQENVEIVRRMYPVDGLEMVAALERPDELAKTFGPHFHPAFEATPDPGQMGIGGKVAGTPVSGARGFVSAWQDWLGPWESWFFTATEFVALPNNRVLVLTESRGRLKIDGVEVKSTEGAIWTVEGGLLRRFEMYLDTKQALEAAGLSE